MDSVRGCVGGAALSPGIVAARLLCRCFVTDRKVACLVCAKPRPRSLGTFAIIRKNDRSTIKPASKGTLLSQLPVLSAERVNQEEKGSGDREVSDRNFCDIDFTQIGETATDQKFMSIAGGVYFYQVYCKIQNRHVHIIPLILRALRCFLLKNKYFKILIRKIILLKFRNMTSYAHDSSMHQSGRRCTFFCLIILQDSRYKTKRAPAHSA